jgi:pimeloyl-ACP methyl ester carboxylesterase
MHTVQSADGTTIAYDALGAGPALILVGGAFQHRAIDPRTGTLAELLARDFTVFHYDRRGRGDSGDTPPYAPERELEDIAALANAAGGPPFLFGHSSGGLVALDAAAGGLPVPSVAVYEVPVIVDQSRPPAPPGYLATLTELASAGRRGEAVEYFLTRAAGVPAEIVAGMRRMPVWPQFEAVAHTLPYDAAFCAETVFGGPLPAGRWASLTAPVLVVDGGASLPWVGAGAQAVAGVLPRARRQTIPGQDHAVDPAALAPVLRDFFAG